MQIIEENPIFGDFTSKKSKSSSKDKFPLEGDKFNENRIFLWTYSQTRNHKDLEKLITSNKYTNPLQPYSSDCKESLFDVAVKNRDTELFKLCLKEMKNKNRPNLPSIPLTRWGTGTFNHYQFGFFTAPVMLGRGGKEGNNAFTHDEELRDSRAEEINLREFFQLNPTVEMMKTLILNKFVEESDIYDEMVLLA